MLVDQVLASWTGYERELELLYSRLGVMVHTIILELRKWKREVNSRATWITKWGPMTVFLPKLPVSVSKNISYPVTIEFRWAVISWYKYVLWNTWGIFILACHLLFFWNSHLTGSLAYVEILKRMPLWKNINEVPLQMVEWVLSWRKYRMQTSANSAP